MKEWKPSRTAQAVAAERALLNDWGVLDDPFAAGMLSSGMAAAYRMARLLPRRAWARSVTLAGLAGRVLWFDREVVDAIGSGFGQIVTVGAGYDSRPWRFGADGARFFEVDHPATQEDKRRRAPEFGPVFVPGVHRRPLMLQKVARAGSSEGFRLGVDRQEAVGLVTDSGWEPERVVPDRDAAMALVPTDAGLPREMVTEATTHIASVRR